MPIRVNYKVDKTVNNLLKGNSKYICIEEAKVKRKTARAELEFVQTGSVNDKNRGTVAAGEWACAESNEECDDQSGYGKDVCVIQVKAIEVRILTIEMTKDSMRPFDRPSKLGSMAITKSLSRSAAHRRATQSQAV